MDEATQQDTIVLNTFLNDIISHTCGVNILSLDSEHELDFSQPECQSDEKPLPMPRRKLEDIVPPPKKVRKASKVPAKRIDCCNQAGIASLRKRRPRSKKGLEIRPKNTSKPLNCLHFTPLVSARNYCRRFWDLVNELPPDISKTIQSGNFFYKMYPKLIQFCAFREKELTEQAERNIMDALGRIRPAFKVPPANYSVEEETIRQKRVLQFREQRRKKERQKSIQRLIQLVREQERETGQNQKSKFVISRPPTELSQSGETTTPPTPTPPASKYTPEMEALRQRNMSLREEVRARREHRQKLLDQIYSQLKNPAPVPAPLPKKSCDLADCASLSANETFAEMEEYDEIVLGPVQTSCDKRHRPAKYCDGDGILRMPSPPPAPAPRTPVKSVALSNSPLPVSMERAQSIGGEEGDYDPEEEEDMIVMLDPFNIGETEVDVIVEEWEDEEKLEFSELDISNK